MVMEMRKYVEHVERVFINEWSTKPARVLSDNAFLRHIRDFNRYLSILFVDACFQLVRCNSV